MRRLLKSLIVVAVIVLIIGLLRGAGPYLILDKPEKSDVLVTLAGDENDVRLLHGQRMIREGYAAHGFVDAVTQILEFGKTPAQHAADYLAQTAPDVKNRMSVCSIEADSTAEEFRAIRPCLERAGARKVLIVTSDFHTRRSLSVARKLLPQYQWSVAAARTPVSDRYWWRNRWALRNVVIEWEKTVWWKLVDSHR